MKFSINQAELQNALSIVLKGVAARSTLPVLSGIYLDAHDDSITLQTTDLELSIQYTVPALIEEQGKCVFPGKLFSEIIKNLPNIAIHIVTENDTALITCDASSFSIKTLNADDFPEFPHVEVQQEVSIPFSCFSSMVKRVSRVVSKDDSRAVLTGVLITLEDTLLKMVATDSYRLAVTEAEVPKSSANDFQAVISGSFLQDVASLSHTDDLIKLALTENQIVIVYHDTVFINRRIEGNFPNYRQLLPDLYNTRAKIDVSHLVAAVKRVSLLGQTGSPVKFDINTKSQVIQLSVMTQDIGTAQETLPCKIEGESVSIAFNSTYILDGLSSIETDEVFLETLSSLKPGIFRADKEEKYLYLVMPVRIS